MFWQHVDGIDTGPAEGRRLNMDIMVDDDEATVFVLPAMLDLTAAEPMQRALLNRVRNSDPLILVGSEVERVSTAVVQVLLAASTEARARGASFQLRDPSPSLADALTDLGVTSHFGC
jgi:anti-anti-sigma regulatory factor